MKIRTVLVRRRLVPLSRFLLPFLLLFLLAVWPLAACRADQPEIAEMVTAILNGSDMGPGDGWFHPGQSRYGWKWLAEHYDADHNGKITRDEFDGPSELFQRLDRNHDGVLTSSDFDWSDRSLYSMQGMPSRFWFRSIDENSNGRISLEEWKTFFERASNGKDYLTPDDLREAFPVAPPPRPADAPPPKNTGPSPLVLMLGLFSGELGSFFEGPDIGQIAPDFVLKTQDGKRRVHLADYRGKKPVVLVFGSFT
jgi:Ca2+-binding EF-hand superfamily protein